MEAQGLTWTFLNESSSLVHLAREATIEGNGMKMNLNGNAPLKGEHTYDKIIWIDSDISWTPEQLFKLYHHPFEVVGGVYLLDDADMTSVHLNGGPMYKKDFEWRDTLFRIDGCGFGFLAIKSGVFENMSRAWFRTEQTVMTNQDNGRKVIIDGGEDLSWCIRAKKELNIDIWCDPTIKVTHNKMQKVKF